MKVVATCLSDLHNDLKQPGILLLLREPKVGNSVPFIFFFNEVL